ncbi:hypothetical protein PTKIN_Ptkin17bG0071400 [Pterospermum kingtungense]
MIKDGAFDGLLGLSQNAISYDSFDAKRVYCFHKNAEDKVWMMDTDGQNMGKKWSGEIQIQVVNFIEIMVTTGRLRCVTTNRASSLNLNDLSLYDVPVLMDARSNVLLIGIED